MAATRPPLPELRLSRPVKIVLAVLASLIVLVVVALSSVGLYTNWLWFGSVHFRSIYSTNLQIRAVMFVVFGLLTAAAIGANVVIAYLLRPPFRPMSQEQQNLERYRIIVEPRKKLILAGLVVLAFLSAGSSAQTHWQTWVLWRNGGSFGVSDPQFGKDVSFFAFDYPMYRLVLSFAFSAVVFSAIAAVGVHYLFGALRLQTPGPKLTTAARRHLTALVGVFLLLKAASYWLDRYAIVFSERSKFTGASYTDVHASLPAKTAMAWIALLIAIGVFASIWMRSALLPAIGLASLLVVSVVANGLIPLAMERFSVSPNASDKEAPYISRNIEATRQAYGIVSAQDGGTVDYQSYPGATEQPAADLPSNAGTINNVRVLDPNVVAPAFTQMQQINNFYGFATTLDVDRYTIDNQTDSYVVGVRELNVDNLRGEQSNWINKHTVYTHGSGFVAADAAQAANTPSDFAEGNLPPSGILQIEQPRVYFGELMSDFSIVGADGPPRENDGNQQLSSYDGKGGVDLSFINRLAFTAKYKDFSFLLNDAVSANSKIIFDRDPRAMAEKIAPFLTIDSDPYPIVADGRIVWMLDGYTTIANYPYAQHEEFGEATTDSLSARNGQQTTNPKINYIRNSVKITVDAFDGTVDMYQWDSSDPVLKAWMKAYPNAIKPLSAMPDEVRAHVRYPQDLFKVQRSLLQAYHVDDPVQFYNERNKWTVPNDPTTGAGANNSDEDQPPYYVLADAPDGSTTVPSYQLTSPMKVNGRSTLAAYISVNSDPGPDYGKMTVLQLPQDTAIQGPEQVFSRFNSDTTIAQELTLFGSQGSTVIHGNLLTLPMGGSFLFVEPLYLRGAATNDNASFPILQRVLVLYGEKIGYGVNLDQALLNLTQARVGQDIDEGATTAPPPTPTPTPAPTDGSTASPPPTGGGSGDVNAILAQMDQAAKDLEAAYKSGDFTAIGQAQQRMATLAQQYLAARGDSPTGSPAPTPSPS